MAKKKGPPYTDDPGCKFIAIQDPWPGRANLRGRDAIFWKYVAAWVYFMLNKREEVEAIYSMNTRSEVIVKLSEDVDIVPLLGAHKWIKFLRLGDHPKDKDRVSYIFEYNYRDRGNPEFHNWIENIPDSRGGPEPPPNHNFPVKFPYPSPSWASPAQKAATDLSLPLPRTRQRTLTPPPAPPNVFTPYERPTHLSNTDIGPPPDGASSSGPPGNKAAPGASRDSSSDVLAFKNDPYEEENAALLSVKQEPSESPPQETTGAAGIQVKHKQSPVRIKLEEPAPDPTAQDPAMKARLEDAIARMRQREAEKNNAATVSQEPGRGVVPSNKVKPEPVESVLPPEMPSYSNDQGSPAAGSSSQHQYSSLDPTRFGVKHEPQDEGIPPAALATPAVSSRGSARPTDPRIQGPVWRQSFSKRVKQEEEEESAKRIKTEQY